MQTCRAAPIAVKELTVEVAMDTTEEGLSQIATAGSQSAHAHVHLDQLASFRMVHGR